MLEEGDAEQRKNTDMEEGGPESKSENKNWRTEWTQNENDDSRRPRPQALGPAILSTDQIEKSNVFISDPHSHTARRQIEKMGIVWKKWDII